MSAKDLEKRIERLEKILLKENSQESTIHEWRGFGETFVLKCGIELATTDYYEIDENGDKKTEFTFDEALKIEEKTNGKWRVPKMSEWAQIVEEVGDSEGGIDKDKVVRELNLTVNECGYGVYWSRTAYSAQYAYNLGMYTSSVGPANLSSKYDGFAVRLIKVKGEI